MSSDDGDLALLPTQRPRDRDQLGALLAPLGAVASDRLLSGGTFCAVQGVELADGRRVVVKCAVPAPASQSASEPSSTARLLGYEHDMLRTEHDILRRLEGIDAVPSPRVLVADLDGHSGPPAIAMDWLPGTPWDTVEAEMSPAANAAAWERIGAIMAAMHAVTGPTFGYPAADFALGAPSWPDCFAAMIHSVIRDADTWGVDIEAPRVAQAVQLHADALAEVTTPRLVHNDLWFGNVLVDPATGSVHGVVDFERALFGDPLQDLCGSDSMNTGTPHAAVMRGLGLPALDDAATTRLALYRLWSMSVQAVEIVPRGFSGDWVAGHSARIAANKAELLRQLGV